MSMNETPLAERRHIAFFGCRNAGKSSLINAVTGQKLAIVSDIKGTTTDPVYKSMELLPAGPVVFIDTPGIDDEGSLGEERVKKAFDVLNKADLAVVVIDVNEGANASDEKIISAIKEKQLPCLIVYNKCDTPELQAKTEEAGIMRVSAKTGYNINQLKEQIAQLLIAENAGAQKPLVEDLVEPGSYVLLVVPIDKAAPKGRLILPQQQVIRSLLDTGAVPIVVRDSELEQVLQKTGSFISLVITDSQAFKKVAAIVPENIPLTSFSILFSRYKGELKLQLEAAAALDSLEDGDKILIAEGCTHHRQCGDIGTQKIPAMLKQYCAKDISFEFTSGTEYPENLTPYRIVIHCGGCMLNEKEMKSRIARTSAQNIPITNYGMVLAKMTGVLDRSIAPLKDKL